MVVVALLIAFAQPTDVASPDIFARGELEAGVIPFHHVAEYRVIVEAPAEATVAIAPWPDSLPGLRVTREDPVITPLGRGRARFEQVITLAPIRPAEYTLPETTVLVDGRTAATLEPENLEVRSLTAEEKAAVAEPQGIITLDELRASESTTSWLVVAGMVTLGILAAGGVWWFRLAKSWPRWRRAMSPLESARMRLAALESEMQAESVGSEAVYMALSSVLRDYLEARFDRTVWEWSTPEFLAGPLPELPVTEDQRAVIRELLVASDRVKYARYETSRDTREGDLMRTRDLIEALAEYEPRGSADAERGAA